MVVGERGPGLAPSWPDPAGPSWPGAAVGKGDGRLSWGGASRAPRKGFYTW